MAIQLSRQHLRPGDSSSKVVHVRVEVGGRQSIRGIVFLLIRPRCFKHSDRIQQTNLRPGNKTIGVRYWIETRLSVKYKDMVIEGSSNMASAKRGRCAGLHFAALRLISDGFEMIVSPEKGSHRSVDTFDISSSKNGIFSPTHNFAS